MPIESDYEITIKAIDEGGKKRPRGHKVYRTRDPREAVEFIENKLL